MSTLSIFIDESGDKSNLDIFQSYRNIILYYDNGQRIINRIINTVFATELSDYTVRKVLPKDYRLFQESILQRFR